MVSVSDRMCRAHAGLMGLVCELAADVILPPTPEAPPAGEQGTQPGPEAMGWLGLPNPSQVAPPAWAALGLPELPPEVHVLMTRIC